MVFVTSITIGNAPFLFFGYGVSAFGMLTAGLLLDPVPAVAVFLVGSAAAMSLTALTHSAFTLVIVGAVLVRTVQVYALSKLRQRMGAFGASVSSVLLGTVLATMLGFAFYGGDASSTTMTFFDAVFILPAYILVSSVKDGRRGSLLVGGAAMVATFCIFLSASPFWIPQATLVGAVALAGAACLAFRKGVPGKLPALIIVFALLGTPLALASGAGALSYNAHNDFYPLYPASLSSSQWVQSNSSASCMQGNIAEAGTVQSGVWGPQRLRVLSTCVTVSGVVEGLSPTSGPANDNDFGIDIKVDPQYTHLLSLGNIVLEGGLLHAEVVPSQQQSLAGSLASIKPGDRITIIGSLVLDTDHGYGTEVHPVWSIVTATAG